MHWRDSFSCYHSGSLDSRSNRWMLPIQPDDRTMHWGQFPGKFRSYQRCFAGFRSTSKTKFDKRDVDWRFYWFVEWKILHPEPTPDHWTRWRYRSSLHLPLQHLNGIPIVHTRSEVLHLQWQPSSPDGSQVVQHEANCEPLLPPYSCRDEWARCPFRPLQHSPWLQFPFLRENECCSKGFLFFPKKRHFFAPFCRLAVAPSGTHKICSHVQTANNSG